VRYGFRPLRIPRRRPVIKPPEELAGESKKQMAAKA
jgi:hypothetical protein